MEAVSKQAVRVLKLFGSTAERVFATCGAEQEYFLIDRNFYFARPDLINAGRTLFGAKPPKGQEMEDQYFGAIPERVLACMSEVETELYKVGVPVKTRHNEVAPSQYEIAPVFENANVAADHQLMTMETLQRVAPKYGLACLLHEKPFAGVNGSGKHNNWSLSDEFGNNLLGPGDTPHDNMQFLVFCAAVLRAVDKWQGLLRASIAQRRQRSPSRRQRGAAGDPLGVPRRPADGHLRAAREGRRQVDQAGRHPRQRRVSVLPKLPRDAGDRNRTSPFAFTGNKFEFRAVGSSPEHRLAEHDAQRGDGRCARRDRQRARGGDRQGRGSEGRGRQAADEDHQGAQADHLQRQQLLGGVGRRKRPSAGSLNLKNTVDALPQLVTKDAIKLLERFKILNEREVHARYEVFLENYNKTINIEGQLMVLMANRYILPAALEYQKQIGQSVAAVKAGGGKSVQGKKLLGDLHQAGGQAEGADRRAGGGARAQRRRRPRSTRSTCATRWCRRWPSCARRATRSKC